MLFWDFPTLEQTMNEERRYRLTLEAMASMDEGRSLSHEEVLAQVEQRKQERRALGEKGKSGRPAERRPRPKPEADRHWRRCR